MHTENTTTLSTLELNPATTATTSILWLHGLGARNDDFLPLAKQLQQLTGLALRFVFPQAPLRAITVNNGYVMPAWYDLASFDREGAIDHAGIHLSVQQINALIEKEKQRGFNSSTIFVAGFSQGAVIALATLLADSQPLGGIIALSGYLPQLKLSPAKHATPIFLAHGLHDEVIPARYGEAAFESLKNANYAVKWHSYPMPHAVCEDEIDDLAKWLRDIT